MRIFNFQNRFLATLTTSLLLCKVSNGFVLPSVHALLNGVVSSFGVPTSNIHPQALPSYDDFWHKAKEMGGTVHKYADSLLQNIAATNTVTHQRIAWFKYDMQNIVLYAERFRLDVEKASQKLGLSLEELSDSLSNEMGSIFNILQHEFPPPGRARHHDERVQIISATFSLVEESFVRVFTAHGMNEADVRAQYASVRIHLERMAITTGDLIEQHPVLIESLLFAGAIMLIPEGVIMRPLLSLLGFGPAGPVKGSSAAWAQRFFWGAAVQEGSWFAHLQSAGATIRFPPGIGKKVGAGVGAGVAIGISFLGCRNY